MIKPQIYHPSGSLSPLPEPLTVCGSGPHRETIQSQLAAWGISIGKPATVTVTAGFSTDAAYSYIETEGRVSDEIYSIDTTAGNSGVQISITCAGTRGLRYAINHVAKCLRSGEVPVGKVYDWPAFARRGVIEGFYGPPWSTAQRLDMMSFLGRHNLNTYFYGPKNDVYHRDTWDVLYDDASLEELRIVIAAAAENEVDFWYCTGPGLTVRYSGDEDMEKLVAKSRQLRSIGVCGFALLLDDISPVLQHPEDQQRFGDIINAHISFTDRFAREVQAFAPGTGVAVCPMQYHGTGTERYISQLGRGLTGDIALMWTGEEICSRQLTVQQAAAFTAATCHRPLYWDNYPVNDANMQNEMHLGPVTGRENGLHRHCKGLVANGMEYYECSKIAFATLADYLWDPGAYQPEESWLAALEEAVGTADADSFMLLADNLRASCLQDANSAILEELLFTVRFLMQTGQKHEAVDTLAAYLERLDTLRTLLKRGLSNTALQEELACWIDKHLAMHRLLEGCLALLRGSTGKQEVSDLWEDYRRLHADYADFALQEAVDFLIGRYK